MLVTLVLNKEIYNFYKPHGQSGKKVERNQSKTPCSYRLKWSFSSDNVIWVIYVNES